MTGRPPRYTAELAERILQEVALGRALSDICAEPGMPCVNTVRQWMADDIEGFAARYRAAGEIGGPRVRIYPTRYTAELADRILHELAHGRALKDICAEPGMPCVTTVQKWVADDTEGFAARYGKARGIGNPLARHWTHYTPEIGERIVGEITSGRTLVELCREPGMPPEGTIRQWIVDNREDFTERYRRAQEIGRALSGGPIPYSAELADRVLGEMMEGRTLVEVCRLPGMPSKGTVLLWVRRNRDGFAARYKEAREIAGQIMVDKLILIGDDSQGDYVTRRTADGETVVVVDHDNINRDRLRSDNLKWALTRALPRIYGNQLQINAKHDAGDGWAELLKELDGKTRGLPSEDESEDETMSFSKRSVSDGSGD
jgi:transposase-like protein